MVIISSPAGWTIIPPVGGSLFTVQVKPTRMVIWKCPFCGRDKFDRKYQPHRCRGGYRKSFRIKKAGDKAMPMSKMMQKVYEMAMRFDRSLQATDEAFTRLVIVEHSDGTSLRFTNASILRVSDPAFLDAQEKAALEYWEKVDNATLEEDPDRNDWDDDKYVQMPRGEIGWLIVFSEHNGTHVFSCGDLRSYAQYERIEKVEEFRVPKDEQP